LQKKLREVELGRASRDTGGELAADVASPLAPDRELAPAFGVSKKKRVRRRECKRYTLRSFSLLFRSSSSSLPQKCFL